MTDERVAELMRYCRENLCTPDGSRTCLLCQYEPEPGETVAVGTFVPFGAFNQRIGGQPDKTRLVFYVLCEDCNERGDRDERVEEKILSALEVQ